VTVHGFLGSLADSFNPLLAIVALVVPFLRRPRTGRATIAYYLSTGAAIGIVYLVRFIDRRNQIWASFGLDYSTHSAFAASLAASIGAFDRRWAVPLALAVLLYFALEMFMRYHGVLDILSSAVPAAVAAFLLSQLAAR
jgi:hypothetical protein